MAKKANNRKKGKKKEEEFDPLEDYLETDDEGAFETKEEEIKKYSLAYKLRHFFDIHKKVVEDSDEDEDSAQYQGGFMGGGSDDDEGDTEYADEDDKPKRPSSPYKLRWYEFIAILVEILLIVYAVLVFFRVVPIF